MTGRWEGVILVEGPSVESCCLLNATALLGIVESNGEKCCIRKKNTGSDISRACMYRVCPFVFNWVLFSRHIVFHIIHMKPPTLNYPSYGFFLK